ncbi:uncharacterized protein TRAVEDRAFT_130473 [Trametes versicolor FP-101664 SS1]|uniref:uncharacterized protein n=1 Tax=Trametes versicolor (strain FP-101664) TaxID=717944 RepID=UPI00046234A2|nr:uncharacterized protein TRAVEDRAFT_130473 [Trametes versicolor FP-101664 SS1]EIW54749.1 hypothetical protein TRAVEDRAFT_130473 [Trametes versicolor FP-101664 SS1]
MISCLDVFKINSQLAKACPDSSDTFGGKSVVLAGDFAQLAPAGVSPSLYSNAVGAWSSSASITSQRCAIGKALWHEFTCVVILRQNMRQQGMSADDIRFRVVLENSRYNSCTPADITVLRTRMWSATVENGGRLPERFRKVSVITARNAHRDAINSVGVSQFAADTGANLYHFHSLDKWGRAKNLNSIRRAQREYQSVVDPMRLTDNVDSRLQQVIWDLNPSMTEHQAGVLSLCENMPVLLKYNEATELCATNGAEAVVDSWDSHHLPSGQEVLDTLYVCLTAPPRNVQLPGLPLNVIPLTRSKKTVKCILPINDTVLSIQRDQVMVLPNFAMTDYASQGRTRPDNVVHFEYCKNHQAVYTCLSRGSSLEGTLIIGPVDASKLTGGPSKALRREF